MISEWGTETFVELHWLAFAIVMWVIFSMGQSSGDV